MTLASQLRKALVHLPGWKTNRKILCLESDDWGSIRMPSRKSFDRLQAIGVDVSSGDSLRYNLFDTLAGASDFEALFDCLMSHRDKHGRHPVMTALSLTANPDFEKIRNARFEEYFYETLSDTLQRYYPNQKILNYWKEGRANRLFVPQFHGREHLNVHVWMDALRKGDPHTLAAFDEGFWGFTNKNSLNIYYQAAFELHSPTEIDQHHEILREGLRLFEELHGYKASYFVPPNGPINNGLEGTGYSSGLRFMCTSRLHRESLGDGKTRLHFRWMGQESKSGLMYVTRNCFFEPSSIGDDWVTKCLAEVEAAFRFRNPAIISSHRVNYIGALDENNRKSGLNALNRLLKEICTRWPEVEFLTTDELGGIIQEGRSA